MKKNSLILILLFLSFQSYSQNYIEEQKRKNESTHYNNSGIMKYSQKDYMGAMIDFNKAIEINPKNGTAYANRGQMKSDLGDYKGAIVDYNKSLEIGTEGVYARRAYAKKALKNYKGAIEDYNKAIKAIEIGGSIFPWTSAPYYTSRGECKQKLGDIVGACSDFRKAGEKGDIDAYELIKKHCN